jgi:hypothetical protein
VCQSFASFGFNAVSCEIIPLLSLSLSKQKDACVQRLNEYYSSNMHPRKLFLSLVRARQTILLPVHVRESNKAKQTFSICCRHLNRFGSSSASVIHLMRTVHFLALSPFSFCLTASLFTCLDVLRVLQQFTPQDVTAYVPPLIRSSVPDGSNVLNSGANLTPCTTGVTLPWSTLSWIHCNRNS